MKPSHTTRRSTKAEERMTKLLVRLIAVAVVALVGLGLAGQSSRVLSAGVPVQGVVAVER